MREHTVGQVLRHKAIAIVRGATVGNCLRIADALYAGGIRLMEIPFEQKAPDSFAETARAISEIARRYGDRLLVGAGTVTTPELAELAANAGARFAVSPDTSPDVIRKTRELGLVSIPGAMTPTEALSAHRAGADFVKLFPVGDLGLSYVRALSAPLGHLRMLGFGGITEGNVADFLRAGLCGVGIGACLADRRWIEAGEFDRITAAAKELIKHIQNA